MKQNGYIRKIDELGRIVIPKEVRKKLGIQDNENIFLEIGVNKNKNTNKLKNINTKNEENM